jgi:hypothetical protein
MYRVSYTTYEIVGTGRTGCQCRHLAMTLAVNVSDR